MSTLIVGASGATGRLLTEELLAQGESVRVIVRSANDMPLQLRNHKQLSLTEASLLHMREDELLSHVQGCQAVASCLGHRLSFKGMFGHPRRLVTEAAQRLCHAIERSAPASPVKYVLMNTTGNQNKQAGEKVTLAHAMAISLIRQLPPHADNEQAAAFLQSSFDDKQQLIDWAVVRPDSLTNETHTSPYEVYASPTRDPLFNPGQTSRVNVAHFMARLVTDDKLWQQWRQQMPVLYNTDTKS